MCLLRSCTPPQSSAFGSTQKADECLLQHCVVIISLYFYLYNISTILVIRNLKIILGQAAYPFAHCQKKRKILFLMVAITELAQD